MQFEYMVLQHRGDEELLAALNLYGEKGWELVQLERSHFGYLLIFKRAKNAD